ncbi:cid11 [Symbiodinium sp. CCMP2592]|nr:cid11 [Symbiodinium sp. CCMP2592]
MTELCNIRAHDIVNFVEQDIEVEKKEVEEEKEEGHGHGGHGGHEAWKYKTYEWEGKEYGEYHGR